MILYDEKNDLFLRSDDDGSWRVYFRERHESLDPDTVKPEDFIQLVTAPQKTEGAKTLRAAIESLIAMGPGGTCEQCGHWAGRHFGLRCEWPDGCICEGMLWLGFRIEMNVDGGGPVLMKE